MELFDFISVMFDSAKYKTVSYSVKKKHAFITLRIMANKFPETMQRFNLIGINQVMVLDYMNTVLSKQYSRKPDWVFLKGKKKEESKQIEKIKSYKKELKNYIMNRHEISERDFQFWQATDAESLLEEFKNLEKLEKDGLIKI